MSPPAGGCPYPIPGWSRVRVGFGVGDTREIYLGAVGPATWYEAEATAKEEAGPAAFLAEIDSEAENGALLSAVKECEWTSGCLL